MFTATEYILFFIIVLTVTTADWTTIIQCSISGTWKWKTVLCFSRCACTDQQLGSAYCKLQSLRRWSQSKATNST